jgi:tripartite-type tricarboxylate transporter receptor subunit TctC
MTRPFPGATLAAAFLLASTAAVPAQDFPNRPVTVVVPFSAGGPTDALIRTLGESMHKSLGQSVLVENVTGAAGTIGVGRVAKATGDGYTLSFGHWSTHVINGAVYPLPFNLLTDLEPVALLTSYPMLLVSKNAVPAKDLKEFVAWVKANQDKASVGSIGAGSAAHVAGVYFENLAGVKLNYIPYRGAAPALKDLLAGNIDFMFDHLAHALPHVKDGKIRAYAITADKRAGRSDRRRGGPAKAACIDLVWSVGTERHAQARDRKAQCGGQRRARRSRGAREARNARTSHPAARTADAGSAGCASEGGDRKMVADREGSTPTDRHHRHNRSCRTRSSTISTRCRRPGPISGISASRSSRSAST